MGNIDKDRIVCRCKKVSEGTIIEAIKNGADTYEKVKKETGANTYGCFACRLSIFTYLFFIFSLLLKHL